MSFLKRLIKVVNSEPIPHSAWSKIVDEADEETLNYLWNEGFESIKYFTRDDWMDSEYKDELVNKVGRRLNEFETNNWFKERF